MKERLLNEPVVMGFVALILVIVLVAKNFGVTQNELLGAVAVVGAVLALVVRSTVTPVP
jgi:hypothetical protein